MLTMKSISMRDFQEQFDNLETTIIDVRGADLYAQGHLPGAVNIPLDELDKRLEELSRENAYHIICQRGIKSVQATAFLSSKGFDVTNIDGGTIKWNGKLEQSHNLS
ncbi:rhodanese-like domain-containing protein [Streptococcus merionis]|uniref:Rhodanese-like domain-containing protein n=2 Tax=Streptococcus merionis TaxID=400065 RepID=A0A239SQU0_9STRE|nr:rhodanese-like domain-containing protein [Streptococcus merionis]